MPEMKFFAVRYGFFCGNPSCRQGNNQKKIFHAASEAEAETMFRSATIFCEYCDALMPVGTLQAGEICEASAQDLGALGIDPSPSK